MFNKSIVLKTVFVLLTIMLVSNVSMAQCAMCRATVGSNLSEGRGVIGTGLNFGILYLLLAPYLLAGGVAFFWFRAGKKELLRKLSLTNQTN
ncbi:hypothetical protein [Arcticibacterium luteifluviistationis]|uniref:hypothetical protein n=1 Tax=Arcticibacterium luteifluviistationis TaxID=1784714 RepID=UPI001E5C7FD3|nr:hypothetical protein [Arcticibacterium luteifluviistationis]